MTSQVNPHTLFYTLSSTIPKYIQHLHPKGFTIHHISREISRDGEERGKNRPSLLTPSASLIKHYYMYMLQIKQYQLLSNIITKILDFHLLTPEKWLLHASSHCQVREEREGISNVVAWSSTCEVKEGREGATLSFSVCQQQLHAADPGTFVRLYIILFNMTLIQACFPLIYGVFDRR